MKKISREDALDYHSRGRKGKIQVVPTKPTATQRDLALAYTPGVAYPCQEIARDPLLAYEYTAKGNLVGVISNGTAVLGLGNIGALAGKPVMEGKGVLFKRFADIDVFDIEIATTDPEEFIRTVKLLEPTFGGINLEDIRSPECFEIERRLKAEMSIPVFHDDQHGTAIISGAALLNALAVTGKRIEDVRIVFSGAGAAALACAGLYLELGARRREHHPLRQDRRDLPRADRGHGPLQGAARRRHPGAHPGRGAGRRRRLHRPLRRRRGDAGDGPLHGARPDRLRARQPRPRDRLRRGAGRPRRTPSSPPAAATIPTRSTTSSASPSSSAARSTCGRPTSTTP